MGVAVGDALGAAFEGHPGPVPPAALREHLDGTGRALYTDDTALTIATAESLLDADGLDLDHLAAALAAAHHREPGRGYGAGTASLLARIQAGGDWRPLAAGQFGGTGSFGNGAAMRSAPIALFAGRHAVRAADLARRAARTTHTHAVGVEGAAALAAAVALVLGGTDPGMVAHELQVVVHDPDLRERLWAVGDLPTGESAPVVARVTGTGVSAAESVPAAIAAFVTHPDGFADTVAFAISLGGDTDTIASMAGALAGAHHGYRAIPEHWVARTEGCPVLVELADRLAARHRHDG